MFGGRGYRRGGGGGNGGGNGRRRMFTKLMKDDNAKIRNHFEALRFLEGMQTYPNKAELVRVLEDDRHHGAARIQETLSMIGSSDDAKDILIPLLGQIITDETAAPLYSPLRDRLLNVIYQTPVLFDSLSEWDFASTLAANGQADIFCSFLVNVSRAFVEVRKSEAVKEFALRLKVEGDIPQAHKLCAILCLDETTESVSNQEAQSISRKLPGNSPVCWVTDTVPPGDRHDNDQKNYRDINLIPTRDELECEKPAWLPLSSGANTVIQDPTQCLLDARFRLLREDAVSTIKENIREQTRPWSNARVIGISCVSTSQNRRGRPAISSPSFIIQVDPRHKKINWDRARALPRSGIVALCSNGIPVRLGTITVRDHEKNGRWLKADGGPTIGVEFNDEKDFNDSLKEMAHNERINDELVKVEVEILEDESKLNLSNRAEDQLRIKKRKREYLMDRLITYDLIEASSSFFSYRPILQVLQRMTEVPFADELVHARSSGERPLYLPSKLKMPWTDSFGAYECDLDDWNSEHLVEATSLDISQARALGHALASRVALIQGPPGCGKTFIGALIARMIRENTEESILCVCYTNHALDQFLEHLLDGGERRIVRIGGRSKSEKLKGYQLRELSRNKAELSTEASRRLKSVTAQLYRHHEDIEALIAELNEPLQWTSPEGGAELFLMDEHPQILKYLTVPNPSDGFRLVGPNNKDVQRDYLWKTWTNGDQVPDWILSALGDTDLPDGFEEFWNIEHEQRTEIAEEWLSEITSDSRRRLHEEIRIYMQLDDEKQAIMRQKDLAILRDARVIGATTSGAAQYRDVLSMKSSGVVIVEEAGEVLEAHVLASLAEKSELSDETKHLILIGDHEQLRPKVENYTLQTVSGKGYNLDRSLFERLILSPGLESAMLEVQHRMRPEISSFIRVQTYPRLQDHESVHTHPDVKGVNSNVVFIDHNHKEDGARTSEQGSGQDKTKSNLFEAELSIELVRFFLLQGYRQDQIVVLTPYVGQLIKIVRLMTENMSETTAYISDLDMQELEDLESEDTDVNPSEGREDRARSVRVSSIDNFQGEEADIVIISLVRSNRGGNIGFLKEEQRVNVLLSRARYGLFIVGSAKTLLSSKKGEHVWQPLLETMEKNGQLLKGLPTVCEKHPDDSPVSLSKPEDFRLLRPNGGCCRPCGYRMNCGHACPQMCHPIDPQHKVAEKRCCEPCRRFPPECRNGHLCPKLCKDPCGECCAKVEPTELPCGHTASSPRCHDVRNEEAILNLAGRCRKMVQYAFKPCGHVRETRCSNARAKLPICPAKCEAALECGHTCRKACGACDGDHACGKKCERILFCGHICDRNCHSGPCGACERQCEVRCYHSNCPKKCNKPCASCVERCTWKCKHQGQCELVCGAPCSRLPCNERCEEKLECGHRCPSVCGEPCPPMRYCQECCDASLKKHVVDMISLASYEEQALDEDPILILPCGHFYACSTLDGHMDLASAYESDKYGNFVGITTFTSDEKTSKPKACIDCRCVIQNVKRYGRILRFAELRSLERKHLMSIGRSLDIASKQARDGRSVANLKHILGKLQKGPMHRVYEACGGSAQVEVNPAPPGPYIRTYQLLGESYQKMTASAGDENYLLALKYLELAVDKATESESHKSGAQSRLMLSSFLLNYSTVTDALKEEIIPMLDWIINHHVTFNDLKAEANRLKEKVKAADNTKILSEVVRAMNKVDGYDYGGSWSSHWHECPNGHPYFIGNCGGAMEEGICLECGEAVGGSGHRLLASNRSNVGGIVGEILRRDG